MIDDTIAVRITSRGNEALAGQAPLLLHPWSQGLLHPQYLHALLTTVKHAGRLGGSISVGAALHSLVKVQGLSRDRALMHLMWTAKYDLVSLGGPEPTRVDG